MNLHTGSTGGGIIWAPVSLVHKEVKNYVEQVIVPTAWLVPKEGGSIAAGITSSGAINFEWIDSDFFDVFVWVCSATIAWYEKPSSACTCKLKWGEMINTNLPFYIN